MPYDAPWDGGCGVFIKLLTLPRIHYIKKDHPEK